jgi:hypothetical protein
MSVEDVEPLRATVRQRLLDAVEQREPVTPPPPRP